MTEYYFLALTLPVLHIGTKPEMTFQEFEELLKLNLSEGDYAQTETIRRFYDIQNMRHFWKNEALDSRGSLNAVELEEALLTGEGFPDYVYGFLDKYDTVKLQQSHFPELLADFFNEEIKRSSGFLKAYLSF